MPKVSILIPTYNSGQFIEETLNSALSQTFQDFEIIIVDNASSDNTWSIISDYKLKYPQQIKVFKNETNIGPIRNWMRCIDEACGEFGKILWSDDLLDPKYLEYCLPHIDGYQNVGFVYSPAIVFDEEGMEKTFYTHLTHSGTYSNQSFIRGILHDKDYPNSPACALFRLTDLKKNLMLTIPNKFGSDASMHAIGNDLLLFLLTAKDYEKFYFFSKPLCKFRSHGKSITISSSRKKLVLNYDIAKAYFVENFYNNPKELRKVNSIFWLHNLVYNHIGSLEKIYLVNTLYEKDKLFLAKNILNMKVYLRRFMRKIAK